MTRKLCTVFSLAIVLGCGKKIVDADADINQSIRTQELPSEFVLRMDRNRLSYQLPRDGQFILPMKLYARAGSTRGRTVSIKYNVDKEDDNSYQFVCSYNSGSSTSEFSLNSCRDGISGEDYGDVEGMKFMLDQDRYIEMDLIETSASGLVIEAPYKVQWI